MTSYYTNILKIYHQDTPSFLFPFFRAPSIERLQDIGQHCGTEYTKLFHYQGCISRFEHSLGVACIIWHFTQDRTQTLAGFFHDISHSVFAHVGDYVLGDIEKQEAAEQFTHAILSEDPVIMKELACLGISLAAVENYGDYPIAENPSPGLSADRLEYNLSGSICIGTASLEEITSIYTDIAIYTNEQGKEELGFRSSERALAFAHITLKNDRSCYSNGKSKISMSFLSTLIMSLLEEKKTSQKELYTLTEAEFIEKYFVSGSKKMQDAWEFFTHVAQYEMSNIAPSDGRFCVDSKTKIRSIDPLVETSGGSKRLSMLIPSFQKELHEHQQRPEKYLLFNYTL